MGGLNMCQKRPPMAETYISLEGIKGRLSSKLKVTDTQHSEKVNRKKCVSGHTMQQHSSFLCVILHYIPPFFRTLVAHSILINQQWIIGLLVEIPPTNSQTNSALDLSTLPSRKMHLAVGWKACAKICNEVFHSKLIFFLQWKERVKNPVHNTVESNHRCLSFLSFFLTP